jgi:hypothetical protein
MTEEQLVRFWSKIDKSGECWLWTGALYKTGYGHVRINRHDYRAHRIVYELLKGPIPEGLFVCHTCDVRRCVRPEHLWLGTTGDNTRDASAKGRMSYPRPRSPNAKIGAHTKPESVARGERAPHAKLTWEQVRAARARYQKNETLTTLARDYGVSLATMHAVLNYRSWREEYAA